MHVAFITGASRGLGAALTVACLQRADLVVPLIRRVGRETRAPENEPRLAVPIEADLVSMMDGWEERFRALPEVMRATRVTLFDNAAVHELLRAHEEDYEAALRRAFAVNAAAPAGIMSALIRLTRQTGAQLEIVHMTSGAAHQPIAGWGPYCASKAAASMLLDVLALENPDVRVIKVDPGVIDTDMQAAVRNGPDVPTRDYFRSLRAEGKLRTPEEAAAQILRDVWN
jgi:benzil reductase ((S)-benzoin forming)